MIKAVIFDVDGTLVDARERFFEAFNIALRDVGEEEVDETKFFGMMRQNTDNLFDHYVSKVLNKPEKEEALRLAFIRRYLDVVDERLELLPGAKETMGLLRERGIRVGIVTSQQREMFERVKARFALEADVCITRDDVKNRKPHGEGMRKLCDALGVAPEEVLAVGDWTGDVLAAKSAGVRCAAVLTGVSLKEDLEEAGADHIIDDISKLPRLLERL